MLITEENFPGVVCRDSGFVQQPDIIIYQFLEENRIRKSAKAGLVAYLEYLKEL